MTTKKRGSSAAGLGSSRAISENPYDTTSPVGISGYSFKNHLGKKAASPFIAWILIMAFVVSLSAFMYSFMVDYTEAKTDTIKETVYNTDECRQTSFSIEEVCVDTTAQLLNITLQNRNYIRIDKLDFRFYADGIPVTMNQTEIPLNPNRKKALSIATNTTDTVTYVEVIPHIEKEEIDIICSEKKVTSSVSAC